MTLHEAIEMILQETGRPMSTREIADVVNKRNLYTRRDGLPISASQIAARVGNYENLFSKQLGKIKLVNDDIVSLKLQKYKNEVSKRIAEAKLDKSEAVDVVIEVLEDLVGDASMETHSDLQEETPTYGNRGISDQDKIEISYRLLQWYYDQLNNEITLPSELISFLTGLDWFRNGNHHIKYVTKFKIYFLLLFAYQNSRSSFRITNLNDTLNLDEKFIKNSVNSFISKQFNNYTKQAIPSNENTTGFFTIGFPDPTKKRLDMHDRRKVHDEYLELFTQFQVGELNLDKAVIITPIPFLYLKQKKMLQAREMIVSANYIDSVVLFPSGLFKNIGVAVSVLILDFKKQNDQVFFLTASKNDFQKDLPKLNEKIELTEQSISVSLDKIKDNEFDLTPNRYIYDYEIEELQPGYSIKKIEDLVISKRRGTRARISSRNLYEEGEYKVIRSRDLNDNSMFLDPNKVKLGVDYDVLENIDSQTVIGGIVLSEVGQDLQANILPKTKTYLIGSFTNWIQINTEEILEEYFLQELTKDYVLNQIKKYSKGTVIRPLNFRDLLQIKIKYPSLDEQRKQLTSDLQSLSNASHSDKSNEGVDFINTLEHSLKQPASGLGSDLASLRTFIKKKVESGEGLSMEESVVPLFSTDTPEQIAIHTLSNTLERMHRAITDIDYILRQAKDLASASATPAKEYIETKSFLNNFIAEYKDITFKFSSNVDIMADRKQLRILFQNFIENANRHGFSEAVAKPTIWIDVKNKNELEIQIFIRNNGKALAPEFKIEDFLAKGESSNEEVGSGFGGYLIGQILKNHKGSIQLTKKIDFELAPHNVEFIITLPK